MIAPLTPVVELQSRLGRVGSIQAWNPWESRKSVAHAKWWVSKVASLSYGNESAKNPDKLFQSIVERGHLSCLEFVPVVYEHRAHAALPENSLRQAYPRHELEPLTAAAHVSYGTQTAPASAFLVECPLYTRSQWMRHRSFSYLELSRRYTKGSKVEWKYYGDEYFQGSPCPEQLKDSMDLRAIVNFWEACEAEYQRRLDAGWPNEIARGCMPMEAITKFWVAGFDRDWEGFLKERCSPAAQPEIRVFADWIRKHLDNKNNAALDAGNLGT